LHKQLVAAATRDTSAKRLSLLEELCKDVLLLTDSGYRRARGEPLVDFARTNHSLGGRWIGLLNDTVAFLRVQGGREEEGIAPRRSSPIYRAPEAQEVAPKDFAFDAQEGSYGTAAAIVQVLQNARDSGLHFSERGLLLQMQNASSRPRGCRREVGRKREWRSLRGDQPRIIRR
jgi:hypothetical protein